MGVSTSPPTHTAVNQFKNLSRSQKKMLFLGFLLLSSCLALPLDVDEAESTNAKSGNLKAASPLTNCGCQCSSLTFSDSAGVVQGNCRTVDGSGARWCYVDAALGSSCQDLTPSARFPNNPWSYEACATPAIGTLECPAIVATVPATVAVPAPHHPVVQPAHPEVFSPYPEPPLDCRVPIAGCPGFVPNPAPTDAFGPTNIFPDNVRGGNSNVVNNNVDDNIFPDNVRSQDLSSEVN